MRKTGPKKRGKRSMCNISSERYTKETPKNIMFICSLEKTGPEDLALLWLNGLSDV